MGINGLYYNLSNHECKHDQIVRTENNQQPCVTLVALMDIKIRQRLVFVQHSYNNFPHVIWII